MSAELDGLRHFGDIVPEAVKGDIESLVVLFIKGVCDVE